MSTTTIDPAPQPPAKPCCTRVHCVRCTFVHTVQVYTVHSTLCGDRMLDALICTDKGGGLL